MRILTGVDIVEVSRIKESIEKLDNRFTDRVFTEAERLYCESRGMGKYESYAGRFAAKEAASKMLGFGMSHKVFFDLLEVENGESGKPHMNFLGEAGKLVKSLDIVSVDISISHTKDMAVAVVSGLTKN